jgi:hypothetical protein
MLRKSRVFCKDEDKGSSCAERTETQCQNPRRDTRGLRDQNGVRLGDGIAEG